jgi:hypothetical protein
MKGKPYTLFFIRKKLFKCEIEIEKENIKK